jgi:hypothetical protein
MVEFPKKPVPDTLQALQELDPGNRISGHHKKLMEMQLFTLEKLVRAGKVNRNLSLAEVLQVLMFSRGAIDYVAQHNFPENDPGGLQYVWATQQQLLVAEMFCKFPAGEVKSRAEVVKLSLDSLQPNTTAHQLAERGYAAAHRMHAAVQSGVGGDLGFALIEALRDCVASKSAGHATH